MQIGTGKTVAWIEIDCPHCGKSIPFKIDSDVYPFLIRAIAYILVATLIYLKITD